MVKGVLVSAALFLGCVGYPLAALCIATVLALRYAWFFFPFCLLFVVLSLYGAGTFGYVYLGILCGVLVVISRVRTQFTFAR
jgi:hypothetical protein